MKEHRRLTPAQVYVRVATIIALPLAFVALLPAGYAVWRVWQVADDAQTIAQENRAATCSFVRDLQDRYESTEAYVELLRKGSAPIFPGVTLAELEETQTNRKATLDSFASLDCNGGEGT